MQCPRCEGPLDERERDGVVVDVCRTCRGVWLDRGELEKLIARAARELEQASAFEPRPAPAGARGEYREGYVERRDEHGRPYKRPKRWYELLEDVFD